MFGKDKGSYAMKDFLCSLCVGFILFGQSGGFVVANEAADAVIRKATEDIYHALEEDCELLGESPEHLYVLVDRLLIPHADFTRMAQWVLGKHWREADEQQRRGFVEQFRQLLIRTYSTAIQLATPDDIQYLPQRESARPDRAAVRVEIRRPGEAVVMLTYSLYQEHGVWLVYDILVDGVSLVSSYRTTFADEIRLRGFQGLLDAIRSKNNEAMSASTADDIRSKRIGRCSSKGAQ